MIRVHIVRDNLILESDFKNSQISHFSELLQDLRKAIDVLTSEEINFKVLSDLAVAEVESELHISMNDVNLDGSLKASTR